MWSSLHGMSDQEVIFLSVADDMGDPGTYKLVPAMTKYKVVLHDAMGRVLMAPGADDAPVYQGGADESMDVASTDIAVYGIQVMSNAGDCGGDMVDGGWNLADLTSLIPAATEGSDDFTGLDEMVDASMNASRGWVKFLRGGPVKAIQKCTRDFGDGDAADLAGFEDADGVPVEDERTYNTGTLVKDDSPDGD